MKVEAVVATLRERGHRMTAQRIAIVEEIAGTRGHIAPSGVIRKVQERMPEVNASTVYRTLELLEDVGVVRHAHLEHGAEYHRVGEGDHVHLVCSRCGREEGLDDKETGALKTELDRLTGFEADLTHFAIAGLCPTCRAATSR
jgi:Fur family ferric uptake transcriptional regulator